MLWSFQLICTLTPASSNTEETHNTLKFAHRSKYVEIKAAQNKVNLSLTFFFIIFFPQVVLVFICFNGAMLIFHFLYVYIQIIDEKSLIKKYQREITSLKEELQQLKRGMMETPNIPASTQEDLVNLKLQVCAATAIFNYLLVKL